MSDLPEGGEAVSDGGTVDAGPPDVTAMLAAWRAGDRGVEDRLVTVIYPELRRIAARELLRERREPVDLQVTEIVHEVYLRLVGSAQPTWQDRAHFFAITTRLMRRVLVEQARRRQSRKRGGAGVRIGLDPEQMTGEAPNVDLLALNDALDRLEGSDPSAARVVELRYFGGMSVAEVAEVLGLGPATVARRWRYARAWLADALGRAPTGDAGLASPP